MFLVGTFYGSVFLLKKEKSPPFIFITGEDTVSVRPNGPLENVLTPKEFDLQEITLCSGDTHDTGSPGEV